MINCSGINRRYNTEKWIQSFGMATDGQREVQIVADYCHASAELYGVVTIAAHRRALIKRLVVDAQSLSSKCEFMRAD